MNVKPIELRKIAKKAWKVFRGLTYIPPQLLTLGSQAVLCAGEVSPCARLFLQDKAV